MKVKMRKQDVKFCVFAGIIMMAAFMYSMHMLFVG